MSRSPFVQKRAAFTLIELSIVLVILGLLVGGVLAGQALIRAAELRAVTSQFQSYVTAVGTFRDKYFALPGDMSNAATVWSTTANGDADGMIEGSTTAASNETGHFWMQLSLAGLIEGTYTPASWASPVIGISNPQAKLAGAGWNMRWVGPVGTDDTAVGTTGASNNIMFEGDYGNAFFLMSAVTLAAPTTASGVLKAEEAWNIDMKIDDGKPSTGILTSLENQGENDLSRCSTLDAAVTSLAASDYAVTNPSITACTLVFKSGY